MRMQKYSNERHSFLLTTEERTPISPVTDVTISTSTNLVEEKSELTKYDTSSVADRFSWLEEERGLDLSLITNENAIERHTNDLSVLNKILTTFTIRDYGLNKLIKLEEEGRELYEEYHKRLILEKRYPSMAEDIELNATYIYNEWTIIAQRFNKLSKLYPKALNEYPEALDMLYDIRPDLDHLKDKRASKYDWIQYKMFCIKNQKNELSQTLDYSGMTELVSIDMLDITQEVAYQNIETIIDENGKEQCILPAQKIEVNTTKPEYNQIHWHEVCRQGELMESHIRGILKSGSGRKTTVYTNQKNDTYIIDEINEDNAAFLLDRLSELMAKRLITSYHYARCSYLVARYLDRTTKGMDWYKEVEMFKTMGEKFKPNRTVEPQFIYSSTYEDRFYGEVSFDMDDAIDFMRHVRKYADMRHMSLERAYYELLESQEE